MSDPNAGKQIVEPRKKKVNTFSNPDEEDDIAPPSPSSAISTSIAAAPAKPPTPNPNEGSVTGEDPDVNQPGAGPAATVAAAAANPATTGASGGTSGGSTTGDEPDETEPGAAPAKPASGTADTKHKAATKATAAASLDLEKAKWNMGIIEGGINDYSKNATLEGDEYNKIIDGLNGLKEILEANKNRTFTPEEQIKYKRIVEFIDANWKRVTQLFDAARDKNNNAAEGDTKQKLTTIMEGFKKVNELIIPAVATLKPVTAVVVPKPAAKPVITSSPPQDQANLRSATANTHKAMLAYITAVGTKKVLDTVDTAAKLVVNLNRLNRALKDVIYPKDADTVELAKKVQISLNVGLKQIEGLQGPHTQGMHAQIQMVKQKYAEAITATTAFIAAATPAPATPQPALFANAAASLATPSLPQTPPRTLLTGQALHGKNALPVNATTVASPTTTVKEIYDSLNRYINTHNKNTITTKEPKIEWDLKLSPDAQSLRVVDKPGPQGKTLFDVNETNGQVQFTFGKDIPLVAMTGVMENAMPPLVLSSSKRDDIEKFSEEAKKSNKILEYDDATVLFIKNDKKLLKNPAIKEMLDHMDNKNKPVPPGTQNKP